MKEQFKAFTKQLSKYIALIIMGGLLFSSGLFIGCKTFDPIFIEGQPDECNDMYTTMRLYVKTGVKSDSLITTASSNCGKARVWKKEKQCKRWIFKNKKIDKNQFPEYAYYLECIK